MWFAIIHINFICLVKQLIVMNPLLLSHIKLVCAVWRKMASHAEQCLHANILTEQAALWNVSNRTNTPGGKWMFRQNLIRQLPRNFENFIIVFFSRPAIHRSHASNTSPSPMAWLSYHRWPDIQSQGLGTRQRQGRCGRRQSMESMWGDHLDLMCDDNVQGVICAGNSGLKNH